MKKIYIYTFTILFSACCYSYSSDEGSYKANYLGVGYIFSTIKFKKNFGENIISKTPAPGVHLFLGHMFNKYFGFELGAELYKKMTRIEPRVGNGAIVLGQQLPSGPEEFWESHKTIYTQRNVYFGVVSKINISENNFFSILTGISIARVKIIHNVFDDIDGYIKTEGEIWGNFCKNKLIPVINIAVEHQFGERLGIRGLFSWKNSARFKQLKHGSSSPVIKTKDTYAFGVGVAYYI